MADFENFPAWMKKRRNWVCRIDKAPCDNYGRMRKRANRKEITWKDPAFWLDFDTALDAWKRQPGKINGIGWIVARDPALGDRHVIGGDFDCCRDPVTGQASEWVMAQLRKIGPYVEVSPSGCGFRWFAFGKLPEGVDSIIGNGPDDLNEEMKANILEAKPSAREKLNKGENPFNGFEVYENGRHLTVTGEHVEGFPTELEDRRSEILDVFGQYTKGNSTAGPRQREGKPQDDGWNEERKTLPKLYILDVVDIGAQGWKRDGHQYSGPHPTLGSTTGHNLVVDPDQNCYCYMHDGVNAGGDAWTWLARECGVIGWEDDGKGALSDPDVIECVKRYALKRDLFDREELELPPTLEEALIKAEANLDPEKFKKFEIKMVGALAEKVRNQGHLSRSAYKQAYNLLYQHKEDFKEDLDIERIPSEPPAPVEITARALRVLKYGEPLQFLVDSCQRMVLGADKAIRKLACCMEVMDVRQSMGLHPKLNGESGSGKSLALLVFTHHLPPDAFVTGSMSNKAGFYHKNGDRVMRLLDDYQAGNEDLDTTIKQTSSVYHKRYEHRTVVKQNPVTFRMGSEQCWAITSVDSGQDIQVLNRQIPINVDDSEELTKIVNRHTIDRYGNGQSQYIEDDQVWVCREMFKILRSEGMIDVRVPFCDRIDWLENKNRRNPSIFMDLHIAHTAINRKQRQRDDDGYYLATEADFTAAKDLFTDKDAEELVNRLTRKERELAQLLTNHPEGMDREAVAKALKVSTPRVTQIVNGEKGKGGLQQKLPGLVVEDVVDTEGLSYDKKRSKRRVIYKLGGYDPISGFEAVVVLRDKSASAAENKDGKDEVRSKVRKDGKEENSNSSSNRVVSSSVSKESKERMKESVKAPPILAENDSSLKSGEKPYFDPKSATVDPNSNLTQGLLHPYHPYSESPVTGGKTLSKADDVAPETPTSRNLFDFVGADCISPYRKSKTPPTREELDAAARSLVKDRRTCRDGRFIYMFRMVDTLGDWEYLINEYLTSEGFILAPAHGDEEHYIVPWKWLDDELREATLKELKDYPKQEYLDALGVSEVVGCTESDVVAFLEAEGWKRRDFYGAFLYNAPEKWRAKARECVEADTVRVKEQITRVLEEGDDVTINKLMDALNISGYEIYDIIHDELHWDVDEDYFDKVCRPNRDGKSWLPEVSESRQGKLPTLDQEIAPTPPLAGNQGENADWATSGITSPPSPANTQSKRSEKSFLTDDKIERMVIYVMKFAPVEVDGRTGIYASLVAEYFECPESVVADWFYRHGWKHEENEHTGKKWYYLPDFRYAVNDTEIWKAFQHVVKTEPLIKGKDRCVKVQAIAARLKGRHEDVAAFLEKNGCVEVEKNVYAVPEELYTKSTDSEVAPLASEDNVGNDGEEQSTDQSQQRDKFSQHQSPADQVTATAPKCEKCQSPLDYRYSICIHCYAPIPCYDEIDIVWLDDPLKYTYLRETYVITKRPKKFNENCVNGKLIGYAVHRPKGRRSVSYDRRCWYVTEWDRDLCPNGNYANCAPCEAVLPSSIEVGKPSLPFDWTKEAHTTTPTAFSQAPA